jgi:predicted exporter
MKKPFFHFPEDKSLWPVWLAVHLLIPALLALSVFVIGPVRINTQLLDMLPQPEKSRAAAKADMALGERNGREAIVLSAAKDFEDAKNGAIFLYSQFENSPMVEKLSLYFDSAALQQFADYFFDYRFVITWEKTVELLETGRATEIAEDALAAAYGAFTFLPLDNIDRDPFLLAERQMKGFLSSQFLSGGKLSLKDDVLAAKIDETWYVLLRMTLTQRGVSLRGGENAVKKIYKAAESATMASPGLEFYFSGVPFHSYESASSAQREISIISTVTLIIILALFIFTFRSLLPVLLSVLAALVSLALASASALLVFREIHIITFVFGTTLIGTCVDYSVHFFVHWKGNHLVKNGYEIRSAISKSIIMSFLSTEICFFAFLFAPFPILKQFAVFSMTGLLSSFLTSFCLYPLLKINDKGERQIQLYRTKEIKLKSAQRILPRSLTESHGLEPKVGKSKNFIKTPCNSKLSGVAGKQYSVVILFIFAGFCFVFLLFKSPFIKIKNDITSLYTMSPTLLESEKRAALVLDQGSAPWYFIVSGVSIEETLENEERLVARLDEEVSRGNLGSFLGTTLFVPSIKRQNETYQAMSALLPLAKAQYEYLGFPPEYEAVYYGEYATGQRYCGIDSSLVTDNISNLWIGNIDGIYYSCVLPLRPADEAVFRAIAEEFGFVNFINKASDISRDLDTLTKTMVIFFFAACLVIAVLVFFVYPWRDSLKICSIPVFIILAALTVLTINKVNPGFFPVAAFIPVFGLGLDYIFYMTGKKPKETSRLTLVAVVLSFLTTLLSFGALAASSFVPVHEFGLTVSAGLLAAFISAMLLAWRVN